MKINPALTCVVEVKETSDVEEVAQLLSSGNWIAICATTEKPFLFSMGRVRKLDVPIILQPSN